MFPMALAEVANGGLEDPFIREQVGSECCLGAQPVLWARLSAP